MSTIKVNEILDASGGNTAQINGATPTAYNTMGRNRIINGAMEIDQRNAGASVSITTDAKNYVMDRFWAYDNTDGAFSLQQVTTASTGFVNSAKVTITTADASVGADQYAGFSQLIEGVNSSDLAWGTASAKTVTLSFWVRSSVTGTFGGSLRNNAADRSYPFSYSISAADTWEHKTITIAGDTTGTWLTTTGIGIRVNWSIADGSNRVGTAGAWAGTNYAGATGQTQLISTLNATWYITGVQLEVGSVATEFERRPYGTELALCQRYFYMAADGASKTLGLGTMYTSTEMQGAIFFPVTMRATPTLSAVSGTNYYEFIRNGAADPFNSLSLGNRTSTTIGEILNNTEVSGTVGHSGYIRTDNAAVKVGFSAEL